MEHQTLSLAELNYLVKETIRIGLPGEYWLRAELSEVRTNYSGHCYLEFVQKAESGSSLLAKARGIIWNSVYSRLKPYFEAETGQPFAPGIQVLVRVSVDFHEVYGYSLTVTDIDPTYTLGDMARRRKEILLRLEAEGILTMNKELEMPELPRRIAVISSATAAGYGDFCNQLLHNTEGFAFYPKLFPAVMQGGAAERSVIDALNRIFAEAERWDVVVIIRGGGATSDLTCFDSYDLAVNCSQFPLPIITGIGHERDDTVLDCVAHTRVKTPTAAAEYLIDCMRRAAGRLEQLVSVLLQEIPRTLANEKKAVEQLSGRLSASVRIFLQSESFRQERFAKRMQLAWQTRFMNEQYRLRMEERLSALLALRLKEEAHRLALLEQKIESASPELLLKRGYSITLKDGKAVTDATTLQPGDEITTRLSRGEINSKVL